mgnify:CR=1 FL=1
MTSYKTDSLDWVYSQDFLWNKDVPECIGVEQSPINIDTTTDNIKESSVLCELKTHFNPGLCSVNFNKHNEIIIDYKVPKDGKISSVTFNSQNHELSAVRIFSPSLHHIDGQIFDMEIMMQFDSGVAGNIENLASGASGVLLCRMLNKSNHEFGMEEDFLNQFIHKIPSFQTNDFVNVPVSSSWNINQLLPEKNSFFYYDGSLPRPPCQENYTVIVYEDIGNVGLTNFELIKKYVMNNARTVQPIGSRKVFYNSGTTTKKTDINRADKLSLKRFLQCSPSGEPREITTEIIEEDKKDVDENAFSVELARKIKNYFLFFFITLLFIFAYFTILFLHKTGIFQQIVLSLTLGNKDSIIKRWKSNCGRNSF